MKLAIFGGSGRTGQHLVEAALAAGHTVRALVRDPARLGRWHERLEVVRGDVLDAARVAETVAGADAVISVLGHALDSPPDVLTAGTRNLLEAMRAQGVRRLVVLTGAGVADPEDRPQLWNRIIKGLLTRLRPALLADAERQATLIRASDLDWVIVRVPRLSNGPRRGRCRVGYVGRGTGPVITRADTADFLLKQVADDTYLRKAPMISN